jgi:hypothetical protein
LRAAEIDRGAILLATASADEAVVKATVAVHFNHRNNREIGGNAGWRTDRPAPIMATLRR